VDTWLIRTVPSNGSAGVSCAMTDKDAMMAGNTTANTRNNLSKDCGKRHMLFFKSGSWQRTAIAMAQILSRSVLQLGAKTARALLRAELWLLKKLAQNIEARGEQLSLNCHRYVNCKDLFTF